MTLCRHFDQRAYAHYCAVGRHAPDDCQSCQMYDADAPSNTEGSRIRSDVWAALVKPQKKKVEKSYGMLHAL